MLDLEEHAAIITTRSVLRLLRGQLLLCVAAWLLCSIAHHLLQAPPPAAAAAPAAAGDGPAEAALELLLRDPVAGIDRFCALVCEAMCGAMGAVAGQVVSVSGGWAGGPSAGWLRAQGGGGPAALLFRPEGYHDDAAAAAAGRYFEGWYYKAVLEPDGERSLVFIPGVLLEPGGDGKESGGFGFVIVVDSAAAAPQRARLFRYPANATGPAEPQAGEGDWAFTVGPNRFSAARATVQLDGRSALSCEVSGSSSAREVLLEHSKWQGDCGTVIGELVHHNIQPVAPSILNPDVMGWLAYLPHAALPCRHGVVSLGHDVSGSIAVNGGAPVAVRGRGYLEKDWGTVFPRRWLWLQCNAFFRTTLGGEAAAGAAAGERTSGGEEPVGTTRRNHDDDRSEQKRSASLLLSIAELPFPAPQLELTTFQGLLAVLWIPSPSSTSSSASSSGSGRSGDESPTDGRAESQQLQQQQQEEEEDGELWRFATYNGGRVHSLVFDKAAGTAHIVLRTATHSLTVTARRATPRNGHPPLLAELWGPTAQGFVKFIDEILDAEVEFELRRVSDGALLYAASGEHGGLELMY